MSSTNTPPSAQKAPQTSQPRARPANAAAPARIKVLDVRKELLNLEAEEKESLWTYLKTLASKSAPELRNSLLALLDLSATARALPTQDPFGPPPTPPSDVLEVMLREVLSEASIVPIVDHLDRRVATAQHGIDVAAQAAVRARPASRKTALTLGGKATAIAAEEAVEVFGVVIDPKSYGHDITRTLGGGLSLELGVLLRSGNFMTPILSVLLAAARTQSDKLAPLYVSTSETPAKDVSSEQQQAEGTLLEAKTLEKLQREGKSVLMFTTHEHATVIVKGLRRRLAALRSYHLSGAANMVVMGAIESALGGKGPLKPYLSPLAELMTMVVPVGESSPPSRLPGVVSHLRWFLEQLAEIHPIATGPEEYVYRLSPLMDLHHVGAFGMYYYVLTEGRESPTAAAFLRGEAVAHHERQTLAKIRAQRDKDITRARRYAQIIEDKLGTAKLLAIHQVFRSRQVGPAAIQTLLDDPHSLLSVLTQREREIVETEYDNRQKTWEAQIGNKCPHVRLALRLRAVASVLEAVKILKQLSAYFEDQRVTAAAKARTGAPSGEVVPTEWLKCRNCGFRALCPHVRELINLEATGASYDKIRGRMLKYAVRYSREKKGSERNSWSYFCRICAEKLAEFTSEDRQAEKMGLVGDLDDGVRKLIWVEALGAAKMLRFPMPTDPSRFATTAAQVCHPLLLQAEANLLRRGRRPQRASVEIQGPDEEQVEPRIHLYAVIFIYAYVFNLIRSTAGRGRSREIGFESVRPGSRPAVYADKILTHLAKKYGAVIARVEDVTPEFIANRFRDALRMIAGANGEQELTYVNEEKEIVKEIVGLDPIYSYAVQTARESGALPLQKAETPEAARAEFETAMGNTLPGLIKKAKEAASSEALVDLRPNTSRSLAIRLPQGADSIFVYRDPRLNLYAQIYRFPPKYLKAVKVDSFEQLAATIDEPPGLPLLLRDWVGGGRAAPSGGPGSRARTKQKNSAAPRRPLRPKKRPKRPQRPSRGAARPKRPKFQAGLGSLPAEIIAADPGYRARSYQLFVEYLLAKNAEEWTAFEAAFDRFREAERGYYEVKALAATKAYFEFGFARTRRFRITDVGVTYLYDEQGLHHQWHIYVYESRQQGSQKTRVELTKKEIAAALQDTARAQGPLHDYVLVDVRCSICNVLRSQTGGLDSQKALTALAALTEFDTFFSFYESRCPAGGLHEFEEVGVAEGSRRICQKCGLDEALIRDHSSPGAIANARAYYDKFLGKYEEETDIIKKGGVQKSERLPEPATLRNELIASAEAFAQSFQYNFSMVMKATELLEGVTTDTIEAIGSTEGRDYSDVQGGNDRPPPPESVTDPRIIAADGQVRVFLTNYNLLRHYHRLTRGARTKAQHIEELLDAAGVPRHEHEKLHGLLPALSGEVYRARVGAMMRLRGAEDVYKFVIEQLCTMAVTVSTLPAEPSWLAALGKLFSINELKKILRHEMLLSKPGKFNFLIFSAPEGDEEGADSIALGTSDDYVAEDIGNVGEDVLQDIEEQGGEDGAFDPFGFSEVDIEGDNPNLEPN